MKVFFLCFCLVGLSISIECLNQNSQAVDWWVILKMPLLQDKFPIGDNFYYCDSTNNCQSFDHSSQNSIKSTDAPFLKTVSQVNQSPVKLIWNDQLYDGKVMFNHAHSKGLIAADRDGSAIIINHSLPKFPNLDSNGDIKLEYPSNALIYGQHIFCVSTQLDQLETIALSYISAEINVFSSTFPQDLQQKYPNIFKLSSQKFTKDNQSSFLQEMLQIKQRVLYSTQEQGKQFATKSGQKMQIFYKLPSDTVDFYSSILGKTLNLGFVAETWGNGQGGLEEPVCTTNLQSISNMQINLPNLDGQYSYTKDHSKYAISLEGKQPYVCLADFNRQISQHKRGGTAICFNNSLAWNSFDALLKTRQQC